jgi:hypothetical protein
VYIIVPPQPVLRFERLKYSITEILTPPYYERHSALAYLIQTKVSISQHLSFVTSCYFVYIIMHVPLSLYQGLSV